MRYIDYPNEQPSSVVLICKDGQLSANSKHIGNLSLRKLTAKQAAELDRQALTRFHRCGHALHYGPTFARQSALILLERVEACAAASNRFVSAALGKRSRALSIGLRGIAVILLYDTSGGLQPHSAETFFRPTPIGKRDGFTG